VDHLKRRLRAEGVVTAYVFGSAARGQVGPLSDVDIAVLFDEHLSADEQHDRHLRLLGGLSAFVPGRQVDVVNLADATPALAFNAIKDGALLYSDDDATRIRREARIVVTYLDIKPLLERHAEDVLSR